MPLPSIILSPIHITMFMGLYLGGGVLSQVSMVMYMETKVNFLVGSTRQNKETDLRKEVSS